MLIRSILAAAALSALPAGAALAQEKPASSADPRIDLLLTERDADNDGRVTEAELNEYRTRLFEQADSNKDGTLDSAEMATFTRAAMGRRVAARLTAFDTNKDGRLTLDEFRGPHKRRFWRIDANLDGALTAEEMQKSAERRLGRRIGFAFARMDVDSDGKISKNEFADASTRFFRRFDRNDDKTVTREEVAAALARLDSRRHSSRFRHGDHNRGDRRQWQHRPMMGPGMRDGDEMGPRRWREKRQRMEDRGRRGPERRVTPDRTDAPAMPQRIDSQKGD